MKSLQSRRATASPTVFCYPSSSSNPRLKQKWRLGRVMQSVLTFLIFESSILWSTTREFCVLLLLSAEVLNIVEGTVQYPVSHKQNSSGSDHLIKSHTTVSLTSQITRPSPPEMQQTESTQQQSAPWFEISASNTFKVISAKSVSSIQLPLKPHQSCLNYKCGSPLSEHVSVDLKRWKTCLFVCRTEVKLNWQYDSFFHNFKYAMAQNRSNSLLMFSQLNE